MNRRTLLGYLLKGGAVSLLAGQTFASSAPALLATDPIGALAARYPFWREVGASWLERSGADLPGLERDLATRITAFNGDVIGAVESQIGRELDAGVLVAAGGWMITPCEALVCAQAVLMDRRGKGAG